MTLQVFADSTLPTGAHVAKSPRYLLRYGAPGISPVPPRRISLNAGQPSQRVALNGNRHRHVHRQPQRHSSCQRLHDGDVTRTRCSAATLPPTSPRAPTTTTAPPPSTAAPSPSTRATPCCSSRPSRRKPPRALGPRRPARPRARRQERREPHGVPSARPQQLQERRLRAGGRRVPQGFRRPHRRADQRARPRLGRGRLRQRAARAEAARYAQAGRVGAVLSQLSQGADRRRHRPARGGAGGLRALHAPGRRPRCASRSPTPATRRTTATSSSPRKSSTARPSARRASRTCWCASCARRSARARRPIC